MSCFFALPDGFVPGWSAVEALDRCLAAQVDVAGRVSALVPDPGVGNRIDLTRGRVGVGVGDGPMRAALRASAVRSAGSTGYVGIDGESFVAEVDAAFAGLAWDEVGLHGELGILPDPWVAGSDRAWALSGTAPDLGVAEGWMDRSDLGANVGIAVPSGWGAVDVSLTSGEGAALRERNEGKDLAITASVDPLAGTDQPTALVITAFARDGSRGVEFVRDSRVGVRVAGEVTHVGYGAEVLKAWGVDADASRTPLGTSLWLAGSPLEPLYGIARLDTWVDAPHARSAFLIAGVGARWSTEAGSRLAALAGVARTQLAEGSAPVAGGSTFESGTTWFVQVDGSLRASSTP